MARDLKLGLNFGYWTGGPPANAIEGLQEAERLGFDSCWTAEAYGSDCLTPLAWWGSHTERIKLGTALVQMSARTPAATAMAAMSMDHLSGGRLHLGIAVRGPPGGEGWYGHPVVQPRRLRNAPHPPRPPQRRRLRGRRDRPVHPDRRHGGRREHAASYVRALLRGHGREEQELPRRRRGPHGLRGRGRADQGALSLRQ